MAKHKTGFLMMMMMMMMVLIATACSWFDRWFASAPMDLPTLLPTLPPSTSQPRADSSPSATVTAAATPVSQQASPSPRAVTSATHTNTPSPTPLPSTQDLLASFYVPPSGDFGVWGLDDTSGIHWPLLFFYDKNKWHISEENPDKLIHKHLSCSFNVHLSGHGVRLMWWTSIPLLGYETQVMTQPLGSRDEWMLCFSPEVKDISGEPPYVPLAMLDFELRGDPKDLKACLQDVIEIIRTGRLNEDAAAFCTEQLAKPWHPGDTLQTPPWRISLYREPRWASEAWVAEVPPGTSATIVGKPTCALVPSLPGREHNFDLVWPVHVAGYSDVVWVFQADLEQSLPRPPTNGTGELFALPLPYRIAPSLPGTTFAPGVRGKVCLPNDPLRLRAQPGRRGRILILLPPNTLFTVIGGPAYQDGNLWWQVQLDNGRTGWVMDGDVESECIFGPSITYTICPYIERNNQP